MTDNGGLIFYGEPTRGRSCGSCTACCTSMPVELPEGTKPANVRCPMLRMKGCSIYAHRPDPCRYWFCRWLFDPDTDELKRPDKSGYILDPALDQVVLNGEVLEVLQVWVDPKRRDAHRDPALRAYLNHIAASHGLISFVRWSSTEGVMLLPPAFSSDGQWHEIEGDMLSAEGIAARIAEARAA